MEEGRGKREDVPLGSGTDILSSYRSTSAVGAYFMYARKSGIWTLSERAGTAAFPVSYHRKEEVQRREVGFESGIGHCFSRRDSRCPPLVSLNLVTTQQS